MRPGHHSIALSKSLVLHHCRVSFYCSNYSRLGPGENIISVFIMVFLWNAGTNGQMLEKLDHFFVMPTVKLSKYQIKIVILLTEALGLVGSVMPCSVPLIHLGCRKGFPGPA